mmetsp:Transcript_86841/g.226662  ORF Transcript_86841/g.226662 Transcript_86841/m.226662 type:complete len:421 (-) Transcript_86841:49-1311(-)
MFALEDCQLFFKLLCRLMLAVSLSVGLARFLWATTGPLWRLFWGGDYGHQHVDQGELGGLGRQSCIVLPHTEHVDREVEQYWSKGYGRHKYCGLRENAVSTQEPPTTCLSPSDIPLPVLSDEQRYALSVLSDRVSDLRRAGCRTDPSTLARYLRARKGNVSEAEQMLRRAAQWRQRYDIDRVFTHWNLAAYEQCLGPWWLSGGLFGHGKRGQAVAYERLGRCNFAKLAASMPFEELLKCDIVHCERCVAALEEDAIRCGHPLIGVTIVMDMEGFGWDQVQYNAAKTISKLAASRSLLLTEITGQILVVRAPPAVARAWSLFKHLLDPGVVAKVEVVTTADTPTRLRVHIDDDAIPVYLGGSKCIDGDPECRSVLAPGGLPSPSVLARFSALAREKVGERAPPGADPVPARQSAMSCCWGR